VRLNEARYQQASREILIRRNAARQADLDRLEASAANADIDGAIGAIGNTRIAQD
jgi:hypothetical protein